MRGFVNRITYINLLISCANAKALAEGMRVHTHIASDGDVSGDVKVQSALINFYGKCGEVARAERVWRSVPVDARIIPTCGAMMDTLTVGS